MTGTIPMWEEAPADYARPTMQEIRDRPRNGLSCVGSFSGCGGSSLGLSMAGWSVSAAIEFVKIAAETYRANFPTTFLIERDIRKIEAAEILEHLAKNGITELDCFEGSPPCHPAGTMVVTSEGERAIETLEVGDLVLTHEGRWRRVLDTHERRYPGRLLALDVKYRSEPLRCTADHPLLVRQRARQDGRRVYGEPQWMAAADVCVGDALLVPEVREALDVPELTVRSLEGRRDRSGDGNTLVVTERACALRLGSVEVARVLGLYLAEGWRRGHDADVSTPGPTRRQVYFGVAPDEVAHVRALLDAAGQPSAEIRRPGQTAVKITSGGVDLWTACGVCGDGAGGKVLPEWALSMSTQWRQALLDEYVRGDGHVTPTGRTLVGTVSRPLAVGVARLVQSLYGVAASIKRRESRPWSIEGRTGESRDSWVVGWSLPVDPHGLTVRGAETDEWGTWLPVRAARFDAAVGYVYNLEVEEDQSYVADTFASHNCASFSAAGTGSKTRLRQCTDCKGSGTRGDFEGEHAVCEPCKGTGNVGGDTKNYGVANTEDMIKQRTDDLFWEWARLLKDLHPRSFIAENVPGMLNGAALDDYAHKITAMLGELGYSVSAKVMNAAQYGTPQERRRLIFVGLREDVPGGPFAFPRPTVTNAITLGQALDSVDPEDPDHAPYVEDSSIERFAIGRTWHRLRELRATRNTGSLSGWIDESELGIDCERCGLPLNQHKVLGSTQQGKITKAECADGEKAEIIKAYFTMNVPYRDRPCPVVTATGAAPGAASVTHPTECRKMTPAELKAVCGFPADFVTIGTREQRYERFGRAVPPPLYEVLGRAIAERLA